MTVRRSLYADRIIVGTHRGTYYALDSCKKGQEIRIECEGHMRLTELLPKEIKLGQESRSFLTFTRADDRLEHGSFLFKCSCGQEHRKFSFESRVTECGGCGKIYNKEDYLDAINNKVFS